MQKFDTAAGPLSLTWKEIRKGHCLSQMRTAVMAGVSVPTLAIFEADPDCVSTASREKLWSVYSRLAAEMHPLALEEIASQRRKSRNASRRRTGTNPSH